MGIPQGLSLKRREGRPRDRPTVKIGLRPARQVKLENDQEQTWRAET